VSRGRPPGGRPSGHQAAANAGHERGEETAPARRASEGEPAGRSLSGPAPSALRIGAGVRTRRRRERSAARAGRKSGGRAWPSASPTGRALGHASLNRRLLHSLGPGSKRHIRAAHQQRSVNRRQGRGSKSESRAGNAGGFTVAAVSQWRLLSARRGHVSPRRSTRRVLAGGAAARDRAAVRRGEKLHRRIAHPCGGDESVRHANRHLAGGAQAVAMRCTPPLSGCPGRGERVATSKSVATLDV
jgi:hypothetical protein